MTPLMDDFEDGVEIAKYMATMHPGSHVTLVPTRVGAEGDPDRPPGYEVEYDSVINGLHVMVLGILGAKSFTVCSMRCPNHTDAAYVTFDNVRDAVVKVAELTGGTVPDELPPSSLVTATDTGVN